MAGGVASGAEVDSRNEVELFEAGIAAGVVGAGLASVGAIDADPVGIIIVCAHRTGHVALVFVKVLSSLALGAIGLVEALETVGGALLAGEVLLVVKVVIGTGGVAGRRGHQVVV